ncbi:MAG: hypothetical protein WB622_12050 [Acidobacteriaceae bacterium]
MPAHHRPNCSKIRRGARSRLQDRGDLAEIIRPQDAWRDHGQQPGLLRMEVVETMYRSSRNAQGIAWPDLNTTALFSDRATWIR